MIFGAFKRMWIVELITLASLAVVFLSLIVALPERALPPDWVLAVAYAAVFLWIYRRRYGRL